MVLKVALEPKLARTQYLNVIVPAGDKTHQAAEAA